MFQPLIDIPLGVHSQQSLEQPNKQTSKSQLTKRTRTHAVMKQKNFETPLKSGGLSQPKRSALAEVTNSDTPLGPTKTSNKKQGGLARPKRSIGLSSSAHSSQRTAKSQSQMNSNNNALPDIEYGPPKHSEELVPSFVLEDCVDLPENFNLGLSLYPKGRHSNSSYNNDDDDDDNNDDDDDEFFSKPLELDCVTLDGEFDLTGHSDEECQDDNILESLIELGEEWESKSVFSF